MQVLTLFAFTWCCFSFHKPLSCPFTEFGQEVGVPVRLLSCLYKRCLLFFPGTPTPCRSFGEKGWSHRLRHLFTWMLTDRILSVGSICQTLKTRQDDGVESNEDLQYLGDGFVLHVSSHVDGYVSKKLVSTTVF